MIKRFLKEYLDEDYKNKVIFEGNIRSGKTEYCKYLMNNAVYFKHIGNWNYESRHYDLNCLFYYQLFDRYKPISDIANELAIKMFNGEEITDRYLKYCEDYIKEFTSKYFLDKGMHLIFVMILRTKFQTQENLGIRSKGKENEFCKQDFMKCYNKANEMITEILKKYYDVVVINDYSFQWFMKSES